MSSFYGNVRNNFTRASFIFDRTYPNRKAMEESMTKDQIFNGRFVLIEYGDKEYDLKWKNDQVGGELIGARLKNDCPYETNRLIDESIFQDEYDATVWQKIWTHTSKVVDSENPLTGAREQITQYAPMEKYIMVAKLNAQAPKFNLIVDAPYDEDNEKYFLGADTQEPHFDELYSTDLNYKFHVPSMWKLDEKAYFTYNKEGFDKQKRSISNGTNVIKPTEVNENGQLLVSIEETTGPSVEPGVNSIQWVNENNSATKYPAHTNVLGEDGEKKILCGAYNEDGVLQESVQLDTKKLLVDLPELGNTISDIWDLIYPSTIPYKPINDPNTTEDERGYLTKEQYGAQTFPVYIKGDDGEFSPIADLFKPADDKDTSKNEEGKLSADQYAKLSPLYILENNTYILDSKYVLANDPATGKDEKGILTQDQYNTLNTEDNPLYRKVGSEFVKAEYYSPDIVYYQSNYKGNNYIYYESTYNPLQQYFEKLSDTEAENQAGDRDTFFGNDRDPSNAKNPETVAELVRYVYELLGIKDDNALIDYPSYDTVLGYINALKQLLGKPEDKISEQMYKPINGDQNSGTIYTYPKYNTIPWEEGEGRLTEKEYNLAQSIAGFWPLYIKDDSGLFAEVTSYDPNAQYYRDLNSLWANVNDFAEARKTGALADWEQDLPAHPKYIENRPHLIRAIEANPTQIQVVLDSDDEIIKDWNEEKRNAKLAEAEALLALQLGDSSIEKRWLDLPVVPSKQVEFITIGSTGEGSDGGVASALSAADIYELYNNA